MARSPVRPLSAASSTTWIRSTANFCGADSARLLNAAPSTPTGRKERLYEISWVPRFEIQRWVGRRWPSKADGWTTGAYTVPAPAAVTTPKARTLTLSRTFLMLETPQQTDV